jgi:hypothetical protein
LKKRLMDAPRARERRRYNWTSGSRLPVVRRTIRRPVWFGFLWDS